MSGTNGIYARADPRDLPLYDVAEAARYLKVPAATIRSWVAGRPYPLARGEARFEPLIKRPVRRDARLSFTNLVEAHVLRALRVRHRVPMREIRAALRYAERKLGIERLLVRKQLQASPGNLFLEHYGKLINLGRSGQLAMKKVLETYLSRLEHDTSGLPLLLFPFLDHHLEGPKRIVINPRVGFGRPVVASRGISTAAIADRIDAGESVREIAADYGLEDAEVEEAVIYERAA